MTGMEKTVTNIRSTERDSASSTRPGEAYPFALSRLSDVAGAEISGVDLAQPIGDGLKAAIRAACNEHHLLVVRNQKMEAELEMYLTKLWDDNQVDIMPKYRDEYPTDRYRSGS